MNERPDKNLFKDSLKELTPDDLAPPVKARRRSGKELALWLFWVLLAAALLGVALWSSAQVVRNLLDFSGSNQDYKDIANNYSPFESNKETPKALLLCRDIYAVADYDALIAGNVVYPSEPPLTTPDDPTVPVTPSHSGDDPSSAIVPNDPLTMLRDLTPHDERLTADTLAEWKIKYAAMRKEYGNDDIFGWISIPGTNIEYPLVQGTDNDFYLNHGPKKNSTGYGSIYMDYRNSRTLLSDDLTVIYGHNVRNDGTMFNALLGYLKSNPFQKRQYIYICTADSILKYEVFSCYTADASLCPTGILNYSSTEAFYNRMREIQNASLHQRENLELYGTDRVLMLYTCANSTLSKERCMVFGVLVEMIQG